MGLNSQHSYYVKWNAMILVFAFIVMVTLGFFGTRPGHSQAAECKTAELLQAGLTNQAITLGVKIKFVIHTGEKLELVKEWALKTFDKAQEDAELPGYQSALIAEVEPNDIVGTAFVMGLFKADGCASVVLTLQRDDPRITSFHLMVDGRTL